MDRKEKIKEMLAVSPGDLFLKHALALEYIKTGNDDEAEFLFREILSTDPGYVGSYYHLGKLLERKNIPSEAIEVYKKGISIAIEQNDRHAAGELRTALEELED